jgi:hypothetical protein
MEQIAWFYDKIIAPIVGLKQSVISILRNIPFLETLPDSQLEWILIGIVFAILISIMLPLIKWSMKLAIGAVILAAIMAIVTSSSFWGMLPFTALGVAVVLFSKKLQMG